MLKTLWSAAKANRQRYLAAQSPHLPSTLTNIGRTLYTLSAGWIGICWYTGYVNQRTQPGTGPQLILPGSKKPIRGQTPDRPNRSPFFSGGSSSPQTALTASNPLGAGQTGPAIRLAAAKLAMSMVGRSNFKYSATRPYPQSLNTNPCATDCSGFVTLVYKGVGAPDPNGMNYNGQGYTGTLEEHGIPVHSPNMGDLAFWTGPDHVAIVVAGGTNPTIVEFGAPPYPIKTTVGAENGYHQGFLGYRSYLG